jgi:biofilm PGA synthesis N-glycosyltransferase PgaC
MSRVTVVTNVYNEADNLPTYVASLAAQHYPDFQVLFVDDGSTDGSVATIRAAANDLDWSLLELSHVGLRKARAAGVSRVDTELLAIFDADEVLDPACIGNLVRRFDDPCVGAVGGYILSMTEGWVGRGGQIVMRASFDAMRHVDGSAEHVAGGCLMARTDLVRQLGGLSTSDVAEDADLAWRLRELGYRVLLVDDAIAYHRDPATWWGMFQWGLKIGALGFHTNRRHKGRLLRWHQLVKFGPLALLFALVVYWPLGLIALLGSLVAFLYQVRRIEAPWQEKLAGWVVFILKSAGWSIGFLRAWAISLTDPNSDRSV